MQDMLVRLYDLPCLEDELEAASGQGVVIRPALSLERPPVLEEERGRGLGRALLLATLHAQREQGYAYSIIGGVGPAEFYAKAVGAVLIEGSTPGVYRGVLPDKAPDAS